MDQTKTIIEFLNPTLILSVGVCTFLAGGRADLKEWTRFLGATVMVVCSIRLAGVFYPSVFGQGIRWVEIGFELIGILIVGYLVLLRDRLYSGSESERAND